MLRGGPSALRISKNVKAFEQGVAEYFGKRRGIMVQLRLVGAVPRGRAARLRARRRGHHVGGHVLHRRRAARARRARARVRRRRARHLQHRRRRHRGDDLARAPRRSSCRTSSATAPTGTASAPSPTRTASRSIEDSCDALGATLRGTPTGTRSDISVTSFALAHIITAAGTGGMVLLDDDELVDRCVLLRRWGRRSEPQLYGSKKGDKRFFSEVDGIEYDNLFIFDEVGWNFEPSEISAAFGVGAAAQAAASTSPVGSATSTCCRRSSARYPDVFVLPRQTRRARDRLAHVPGPDPARVGDPPGRAPAAHGGARRRHAHGVDRQRHAAAGVREGAAPRAPAAGCPMPTGSWSRASSCR